jgi:hypothetical protein
MAMGEAGFPAYKLTPLEVEVAKASADVRAYDTTVGAVTGVTVGALIGFIGLRKRGTLLKLFTTFTTTTISSTLFFTVSTQATINEWAMLDQPGHAGDGQISFMAEFARRMILETNEAEYNNKQLHVFYRQQLRGQVMRLITEEEEREEREQEEKSQKKKSSSSWWFW